MINLIKNELYKIFHKKGIYIVLIVTALYVILTNSLYSTTEEYDYLQDSYESELYYLEMLEEDKINNQEEILSSKVVISIYEFADSFGKDSWQRIIIHEDYDYYEKVYNLEEKIISYEMNITKDKDVYEKAKKELEDIKIELLNLKEREFVKKQIEEYKELLEIKYDYTTHAKLLALELRYNNNVSYGYDALNNNLETYENSIGWLMELEDKNVLSAEDEEQYKYLKQDVEVSKAYVEYGIDEEKADGQYQILLSFLDEYFIMILVMIILVSGSIVSEEFSKGTIKLLLVKPFTRINIILSKYLTSFIMVLFAILVPIIMQLIVGSIAFGINSLSTPVIVYNHTNEMIEVLNIFKYLGLQIVAFLPELVLISTIAFTLSTLFLSTSLANTLTIIGVFGSSLIAAYAEIFEIEILKYIVTLNWDWTVYLFGGTSPYKGVTFPFSVIICLIYFIVFLILSFVVFKKRNIKNI